MKKALIWLALLLGMIGCTSQGRLTHIEFSNPDAHYLTLEASMEALRKEVINGDTEEQLRAVRALRHLAKYNPVAGRRVMALHGLVFIWAFTDDSVVEASAYSRLKYVMLYGELPEKAALIEAFTDLAIGKMGYLEDEDFLNDFTNTVVKDFFSGDNAGFYSAQKGYIMRFAPDSTREKAVAFLSDHFDDLYPEGQYLLVESFGKILSNPPQCYELGFATKTEVVEEMVPNPDFMEPEFSLKGKLDATGDGANEAMAEQANVPRLIKKETTKTIEDKANITCIEDDKEDQTFWKEKLIQDMGDFIAYSDIPLFLKIEILNTMLLADHMVNPDFVKKEIAAWTEDQELGSEIQPYIEALNERLRHNHPNLYSTEFSKGVRKGEVKSSAINENQPATAIAEQLANARKSEVDVSASDELDQVLGAKTELADLSRIGATPMWMNAAEVVLERQLFDPRAGLATAKLDPEKLPPLCAFFLDFLPQFW